jgi:hypothetical protein
MRRSGEGDGGAEFFTVRMSTICTGTKKEYLVYLVGTYAYLTGYKIINNIPARAHTPLAEPLHVACRHAKILLTIKF